MKFKQKKGEWSKCFRYKATQDKAWNTSAPFNYYPVCYPAQCLKDPTTQNLFIEVTIDDKTVKCTEQL